MEEIIKIKEDFKFAKKQMPMAFKTFFGYEMNDKIKSVTLRLNKSKRYCYNIDSNTVNLGTKFLKDTTPEIITRMFIVHELLHCELEHDSYARKFGYRTLLYNDKLTPKIAKLIGFEEPTKKDLENYKKSLKNIAEKTHKYQIYCVICDDSTYRNRKTRITENIEHYRCRKCKGKLQVIKIGDDK